MQETIQVRMLGEFTIRLGENSLTDGDTRSRRVWSMLAYLIFNRSRPFTQDELIRLYWNGGTESADPDNALKSVFHRIRTLLDKLAPGLGHRLLTRQSGRYVWNKEVPLTLDVEQFEADCAEGDRAEENEARIFAYRAALACYTGDFLPRQSGEVWTVPISAYYHSLYTRAAASAVELLEDCGHTQEAAELCRRALVIEPYQEDLYEHLMRNLISAGDCKGAMAVYDEMSEMLFSNFGVMPSEPLRELYRKASRTVNDHTMSIDELRGQLQEESGVGGAMLCEYDFFKILYCAEARSVARTGAAVHICLLSVFGRDGEPLARRSLDAVMKNLAPLLQGNLRRGDIVARCSVSQYAVMLPMANYENSCMVAERLTNAFYRRYPHSPARLRCVVQPLVPNA